MGGVLVNQKHPLRPFGDDVTGPHLPHHAHDGQFVARQMALRWGRAGGRFAREGHGGGHGRGQFQPHLPHVGVIQPLLRPYKRLAGRAAVAPCGQLGQGCKRPNPAHFHLPHHRPAHSFLHSAKDAAPLVEAHFGFGGMHIHIHRLERQVDKNEGERITADGQQGMVRLHNRISQVVVAHPTAVDKQRNVLPAGAMLIWWGDKARDANWGMRNGDCGIRLLCPSAPLLLGKFYQFPRQLRPVHGRQHLAHLPLAAGLEGDAAVVGEAKADMGIGEGVAGNQLINEPFFGGHRFEEFEPGGDVVK